MGAVRMRVQTADKNITIIQVIFTCKWCFICAYFSPDSEKVTFSLEKAILWIEDLYFSWKQLVQNILIMDLFLANMQLFALQDIN